MTLFSVGFAASDPAQSLQRLDGPEGGLLYLVNTTSDTVVTGACQNGNRGCSLRGVIRAANSHPGADGIEIYLPAGSVINLAGALPNITESVSIIGPGADQLTVRRNTGGNYRIFNVFTTGAVTLSGLTISNGLSSNGDGIANGSGTVNGTNRVLSGNAALDGGGISNNSSGTVNVSDVSQGKGQLGQAITSSNFRSDINVNGIVNASDVSIIKSHAGTSLP